MMARRLASALALLVLPTAASAQSLAPRTTWVNDHAQFVIQSIDADGYGSGFGCAGRAFPVSGWIDGDMISFTVHRKEPANCTPIQAWTGLVREGQLLVEYLAVAKDGTQTGLLKGADRYRRQ